MVQRGAEDTGVQEVTDYARDIGRIEARQDTADDRLDRIEAKLDQLLDYVARNKGGFRMLFAMGSIAAALGASIAEIIRWAHK